MQYRLAALLVVALVALAALGASLAAVETSSPSRGEVAATLCRSSLGPTVIRSTPTTVNGVIRMYAGYLGPGGQPWMAFTSSAPRTEIVGLCWVKTAPSKNWLYATRRGSKPAQLLGNLPNHWVPGPTVDAPKRRNFPPGVLPAP